MERVAGAAKLAAGALAVAGALAACSPTDPRAVMKTLNSALSQQYHECVPVGWNPVPVGGSYYLGYSAEYWQDGVWLRPFWLGRVTTAYLSDANVRLSYDLMNKLMRVGLLERTVVRGGYIYNLTTAAMQYYYEDDAFGNNPEHWPYLCFSRIVPRRVLWIRKLSPHAFRAAFEWETTPAAPWANDAFFRTHSVVLPPWENPVVAIFSNSGGTWHVTSLTTRGAMLPRVVDDAAWVKDAYGTRTKVVREGHADQ
jgi:hypothetical protein